MTRNCSICESPHRRDVDAALIAGRSARDIAAAHGLNYQAIRRHRLNHLPLAIRAAAAAALERVDEGATEASAQIAAAPVCEAVEAVPAAAPVVTPEASSPVPPVRRRQRAIQLDETPPAPPVSPAPTNAPAPRSGVLNVYEQSINLRDRAMALLEVAERAGDVKTALTAIREARGVLEHLSRLEERNQSAAAAAPLDTSAEWIRTRAAIVAALADHPEARIAVAEALVGVGALH